MQFSGQGVKGMSAFQMKTTLEANFQLLVDAGPQVTTGSKQTVNLEKQTNTEWNSMNKTKPN